MYLFDKPVFKNVIFVTQSKVPVTLVLLLSTFGKTNNQKVILNTVWQLHWQKTTILPTPLS